MHVCAQLHMSLSIGEEERTTLGVSSSSLLCLMQSLLHAFAYSRMLALGLQGALSLHLIYP